MKEQVHDDERVMSLVDQALALPAAQRADYLRRTCASDLQLFRLVSGYVDGEERMAGFLVDPLLPEGDKKERRLTPGDLLVNRFRIVREVAQGGMGVVYEAIDEHLERRIALKCAKAGFSRRLRPEVRNASEIGHPNVCKIYEIHSSHTAEGSTDFITMEYLEGETLAVRLREGPLPKSEARVIAIQLCAGVAEAHKKGVIHGDLKTNNIILTRDGKGGVRAVITDFGLARNAAAVLSEANLGLPGGTPGYMAPELLQGEKPSTLSDIFALGMIMCEMLGPHKLEDTLAYVSQNDSPVTRPYTPAELSPSEQRLRGKRLSVHSHWDRVLLKCLDPDPTARYQTADEVLAALSPSRSRWIFSAALMIVLAAVAGLFFWQTTRGGLQLSLHQLTEGDIETSISLSPDGKRVVYSSDRSGGLNLWLQELSGGEPVRLTSDSASETAAVFSPDGKKVAFRSEREGGGIYVTPVPAARDRRLVAAGGRDPNYSPDGKWIAYWQGLPSEGDTLRAGSAKAYVVSTRGGAPRQIAFDLVNADHPMFSPDGHRLLVSEQLPDRFVKTYMVVDFATGRSKELTISDDLKARGFDHPLIQAWTWAGIFFRATRGDQVNICYAPTSTDLKLTGAPAVLAPSPSETIHISTAAGKLAFFSGERQNKIWLLPIEANTGKTSGPTRRVVSPRPGVTAHTYVSPNGEWLVFRVVSTRGVDLVLRNLETGDEDVIAHRGEPELAGRFLGDNSTILFEAGVSGDAEVTAWNLKSHRSVSFAAHAAALGLSADGQWLSWWHHNKGKDWNSISVAKAKGGRGTDILQDGHSQLYVPHFSPDGKWISFIARNGPEESRIFIAPFRGLVPVSPTEWIPVSDSGSMDDKPEWSPNGSLLYYVSDRDGYRCIWARHLNPDTKQPFGPPLSIQHFHELRSSMQYVNLGYQALSVASDKLAFLLSEQNGGIWVADLPSSIQ